MATARQRRRKQERRDTHVHAVRSRLRAALASSPSPATMREIGEHMRKCGYEPDFKNPGKWRRT